jgi:anti-anti-sigma factor
MDISISQQSARVPVTVFHIKGEIDAHTFEQLQKLAQESFQGGLRDLILDLSEVSYVSSAGLRAINNIFNLLRANAPGEDNASLSKGLRDGTYKSHHLKLLNPQPAVFKVLDIAGVDMYLEVHQNLNDALASF